MTRNILVYFVFFYIIMNYGFIINIPRNQKQLKKYILNKYLIIILFDSFNIQKYIISFSYFFINHFNKIAFK